MHERTVTVPFGSRKLDITCHVDDDGPRRAVFLHGLQSNKDAFSVLGARCRERGWATFAPDFVGFGGSARPQAFSYKLEDQAAVVAGALRRLDSKPFVLVGHSMGGMVGTMLLREFPDQLLGFVNMEGNFVLTDCGMSLPVSRATEEQFCADQYPAFKESLLTSADPNAPQRRACLEDTADHAFYRSSVSIVDWSRRGELLELYTGSPVPRLFVYGEKNRRKRDVLPETERTEEIPGAGHFMLADNPADTSTAVLGFLDDVGGR